MLKKKIFATLVLMPLALATAQAPIAQKTVRLGSTPASFQTFYRNFVRSVERGNRGEVASMTSFPFRYGFDAGDEGVWTRSEFLKRYNRIFVPKPLIFRQADPELIVDGSGYTLANDDDASYYIFRKRGGAYKLVSYMVEP